MFDMGGVVSHHQDKVMEKDILRFLGEKNKNSFGEFTPRLYVLLDEMSSLRITEGDFWHQFSGITGIAVPDMHGESLWGKFFHPTIDEDVMDILKRLKGKGIRIVLASNTEPPHKKYHEEHGQYAIFDHVYTSCDLKVVKPDKQFFKAILSKENKIPEECFFTDDNEENCRVASSLGIKTYLFANATGLKDCLTKLQVI
jgi:FMN phosphatase YigB (HAD superfamily)